MSRHLVNVERRFSMEPGKLADKVLRESLGRGWMITVLDADTNVALVLLVNAAHGNDIFSGTVVNQRAAESVRFSSFNVLQIISYKEPPNGAPSTQDLHHAIQAPQVPPLQAVWAALDDRVQGRAARGEARARRTQAHGTE